MGEEEINFIFLKPINSDYLAITYQYSAWLKTTPEKKEELLTKVKRIFD